MVKRRMTKTREWACGVSRNTVDPNRYLAFFLFFLLALLSLSCCSLAQLLSPYLCRTLRVFTQKTDRQARACAAVPSCTAAARRDVESCLPLDSTFQLVCDSDSTAQADQSQSHSQVHDTHGLFPLFSLRLFIVTVSKSAT